MPKIVGIVNCTPDSFSDGAGAISQPKLLDLARRLRDEGADILDIGGDSTRPGSQCVGIEEEWARIEPVLSGMRGEIPCSVDTHHVEVARRALEHGATYINDVSGCSDPHMAELIASSGAGYIFMFNAHGAPHRFGEGLSLAGAFQTISSWIRDTKERLVRLGILESNLIADPGMGAFVSRDPKVSWEILERFAQLPAPAGGLLLGCSRKGFLAKPDDKGVTDRDARSCIAGAQAVRAVDAGTMTYLRVHNVALQRKVLAEWSTRSGA